MKLLEVIFVFSQREPSTLKHIVYET